MSNLKVATFVAKYRKSMTLKEGFQRKRILLARNCEPCKLRKIARNEIAIVNPTLKHDELTPGALIPIRSLSFLLLSNETSI